MSNQVEESRIYSEMSFLVSLCTTFANPLAINASPISSVLYHWCTQTHTHAIVEDLIPC